MFAKRIEQNCQMYAKNYADFFFISEMKQCDFVFRLCFFK